MADDNILSEGNLAPSGSPENRRSLKRIKMREGGGKEEAYDWGESRAVIMKTRVVCNFNGKELGSSKALKVPMKGLLDEQDSNKNETSTLKNDGSEDGVAAKSTGSEAMCIVCSKSFYSKKAMYGHMRCHPERRWRGINPPPSDKTDSWSTVSQKIDGLSPSTMESESTVVSSDTRPPQPLLRWTKTGRRGQNHPLSSSSTWVSSSYISLSHKQGIKDKNQGIKEVRESLPGMYKCSTCDKVFPTFQALGGHRAGHSYKNNLRATIVVVDGFKCNICCKTFPSGQALGGHKRTHFQGSAQATPGQDSASGKASKSLGGKLLDFDINELPPMEE